MPTNWSREAWNPLLTILTLVGTVVILFVVQIAYSAVAYFGHIMTIRQFSDPPPNQVLIIQVITWVPIAGFLLLVLPPLAKTSLSQLGFRAPTKRDLLVALAGAVLMTVVVDGSGSVMAALTHRHDTEQAVALLDAMKSPYQRFAFFLLACIFAPFTEELAFRVFVFNALTRWITIPAAAVVSGLLFGLLHVAKTGEILTVGVPLALGGIILALVYAQTRCFWANVTTHALFNSVSVLAFFFFHVS